MIFLSDNIFFYHLNKLKETKEFFERSKKLKSIYYTRESYEGSEECPCGVRKEFDINGKLINQNEYSGCTSIFIEC